MLRILITGNGHPVAKGVIESLRRSSDYELYIVGVDLSERGTSFDWVDKHYFVPGPEDDDFIDVLLSICERENAQLVIPWSDDEVEAVARNAERFHERKIALLCGPHTSIQRTIDKGVLLQEMEKTDIPVPRFELADSHESVREAALSLGYPAKPVIVKPRRSSCAKGLWVLDPEVDLKQFSPSRKLTLDAFVLLLSKAGENGQDIPAYIVMEYLKGEDYSVDALACEGEPFIIVPRRRLKAVEGVSRVSEVVENKTVQEVVARIIREFSLHLNVNVQLRYRKGSEGEPLIYEVNPRISGSIVANDGAGVKMFYYGLLLALGKTIPRTEDLQVMPTRMVRYWTERFDRRGEAFNPLNAGSE